MAASEPGTGAGRDYVDHPRPSLMFQAILVAVMVAVMASLPSAWVEASVGSYTAVTLGAVILVVLGFYFWPLHGTYYVLQPSGLLVRYGPWAHRYSYSDFVTACWRKGLFATRIGWPSITPCVRLTNAVLLKRKGQWFGLYLTPNDPKAFLRKLGEFAPDLTREAIL